MSDGAARITDDMCMDAMSGARWFSTFDLRSSYHQLAMEEEDSDKSAFVCREGQFKFKTMPLDCATLELRSNG